MWDTESRPRPLWVSAHSARPLRKQAAGKPSLSERNVPARASWGGRTWKTELHSASSRARAARGAAVPHRAEGSLTARRGTARLSALPQRGPADWAPPARGCSGARNHRITGLPETERAHQNHRILLLSNAGPPAPRPRVAPSGRSRIRRSSGWGARGRSSIYPPLHPTVSHGRPRSQSTPRARFRDPHPSPLAPRTLPGSWEEAVSSSSTKSPSSSSSLRGAHLREEREAQSTLSASTPSPAPLPRPRRSPRAHGARRCRLCAAPRGTSRLGPARGGRSGTGRSRGGFSPPPAPGTGLRGPRWAEEVRLGCPRASSTCSGAPISSLCSPAQKKKKKKKRSATPRFVLCGTLVPRGSVLQEREPGNFQGIQD